ncbi:MAG: tRNA (adenosine(37)-N6)-threonylcarbamoyltransferase complex transferase subunit TsaD [Deltaproteobacteria bacterium]|nr:tRNA (adenosine(37)-N6)-threonylcarbamoyltransferase complex transferase subunit TsaD [Deltaproteobacteria bacterium]
MKRLLAIESSCDETAAAVVDVDTGAVLSSVIHSQVLAHAPFGGVVPEIASREHLAKIDVVVGDALAQAGCSTVDVVAATFGPGLVGALLVGLGYAKGLAQGWGVPFVGVHHIEGHLMAAAADATSPPPPFIGLVVSGGHTALYRFEGVGKAKLLGQTRDDAAGEAFDKSAKLLGLGYPGGIVIDQLAKTGDVAAVAMPRSLRDRSNFDFSFSGLKTAVRVHVDDATKRGERIEGQRLADLCASVQEAIVDMLLHKALLACRRQQIHTLVLGGGVAANSRLRSEAVRRGAELDVAVYLPPKSLCTDNAVMIAMAARAWVQQGRSSSLSLMAAPDALVEQSSQALL